MNIYVQILGGAAIMYAPFLYWMYTEARKDWQEIKEDREKHKKNASGLNLDKFE